MKYTITFAEDRFTELTAHLFSDRNTERAAYALCRMSVTENETRLLVRKIIPVIEADIEEATAIRMKIKSRSFLRAMKEADVTKQVFLFIHSHPAGIAHHSKQDDQEETKLFRTAYNRIDTKGVHGSLVLSSPTTPVGRIWLEDGSVQPVGMIRVLGNRFKFYVDLKSIGALPEFFDRQIRAFGEDIQRLFQVLHIGVVGGGGTGSSIVEQLIRLGIGTITISDGQRFESSNVNRVYGSRVTDEGAYKVALVDRLAGEIGLKTKLIPLNQPITYQSILSKFKDCDIVFACTDDHWGRSLLNRLAVYYHIPVIDMGVKIDSQNGVIRSIQGRVTVLQSNHACLLCRERIDPMIIKSESLEILDPKQLQRLRKEGYAPELEETAPSVIPFTTNIASIAISELIHRLTGFMGSDRNSNEVIVMFDESEIRKNRRTSKVSCFCGDTYYSLRGDTSPLLDSVWRPEE